MKKLFLFLSMFAISHSIWGQVSINPTGAPADPSAMLDVGSTDRGLLIPRMTDAQKSAITTPATGLMIFQTDGSSGFYYYTGVSWERIGGWSFTGNSGTLSGIDFIGTTDAADLDIRTDNVTRLIITQKGQIEVLNTGGSVFLGQAAGLSDDLTNNENVFVGNSAGQATTTGFFNVAIGGNALTANTTGISNIAVGRGALAANTTASSNTAVGNSAMTSNTLGVSNVAMGQQAMQNNIDGNLNVGIGLQSLLSNTDGEHNVGLGAQSLQQNITGNNNTGLGHQSLLFSTAAGNNTAVGYHSLRANISGEDNTAVGYQAGKINTLGSNNTFVGSDANASVNNLTNAAAIGSGAVVSTSNSMVLGNNANVGIGTSSPSDKLHVVGTSGNTVRIEDGNQAAGKVLTSDANGNASWQAGGGVNTDNQDLTLAANILSLTNDATTVDLSAYLDNTDAQDLSLTGTTLSLTNDGTSVDLSGLISGWSLSGNTGTTVGTDFMGTTDNQPLMFKTNNVQAGYISNSSNNITFLGYGAGANAVTTSRNTAFGYQALNTNTTGAQNEAIGAEALYSNTTGDENVGMGNKALYSNTTGNENIGIGSETLHFNTTGNRNIAIGHRALELSSTGTGNIGIGYFALNPTRGNGNVGLGNGAGNFNNTGNFNTCIGHESNVATSALSNTIVIGSQATVNASNKVRIGNTAITVAEIQVPWTITSDKNAKKDIQYDVAGLDFINELKPATYRYKTHDAAAPRYTGLLAQDVDAILREKGIESSLVTKPNADGTGSWGIRYAELTLPLVNAVQELSEELEESRKQNKALKIEVAELKAGKQQVQQNTNEVASLKAELDAIKVLLNTNASK